MLMYLLLIYILLFILTISHFERKLMYDFVTQGGVRNSMNVSEYTNNTIVGKGILKVLLSPFYLDKYKFTKISDGTILNSYCYHDKYFEKQREMSSKMFWNDYFVENGIKTPQLYATTNPFILYKNILPDEEYIAKPNYGLQGTGIHVIKGEDVKPTESTYLIQEKIHSCEYEGGRSFRVVTTYDGEILSIEELRNDTKITSNGVTGGKVKMCTTDMCGEYEKLREPIQKLCELHKRDFGFCFCIGWDLMVDCNDAYAIEGNWPPGLFNNKGELPQSFYELFTQKAKKFYNQ